MAGREVSIALPDDFGPGMRKLAFIDGVQIVILNVAGTLHAIENSCPHAGASLASGKLEGLMLRCPSHGLKFNVADGCIAGGGAMRVQTYPIVTANGGAVLTLPE